MIFLLKASAANRNALRCSLFLCQQAFMGCGSIAFSCKHWLLPFCKLEMAKYKHLVALLCKHLIAFLVEALAGFLKQACVGFWIEAWVASV